jgi:hypothetical protein
MALAMQPGGGPSPTGLADVTETILDKGLVIDAYIRVSLVGIEALTEAEGRAQYVVKGRYVEQAARCRSYGAGGPDPRRDDLAQALSGLAADWEGRVEMRLLGPMAAYHFTTTPLVRSRHAPAGG